MFAYPFTPGKASGIGDKALVTLTYAEWTALTLPTDLADDTIYIIVDAPILPVAKTVGDLPTAAAAYRGMSFFVPAAAGADDIIVTCFKAEDDNYDWDETAAGGAT